MHLNVCSTPVAGSECASGAYDNISGKKDGQRGGILCVVEVQILLKALEASVGQVAAL